MTTFIPELSPLGPEHHEQKFDITDSGDVDYRASLFSVLEEAGVSATIEGSVNTRPIDRDDFVGAVLHGSGAQTQEDMENELTGRSFDSEEAAEMVYGHADEATIGYGYEEVQ